MKRSTNIWPWLLGWGFYMIYSSVIQTGGYLMIPQFEHRFQLVFPRGLKSRSIPNNGASCLDTEGHHSCHRCSRAEKSSPLGKSAWTPTFDVCFTCKLHVFSCTCSLHPNNIYHHHPHPHSHPILILAATTSNNSNGNRTLRPRLRKSWFQKQRASRRYGLGRVSTLCSHFFTDFSNLGAFEDAFGGGFESQLQSNKDDATFHHQLSRWGACNIRSGKIFSRCFNKQFKQRFTISRSKIGFRS